jgi:hypothetical protein
MIDSCRRRDSFALVVLSPIIYNCSSPAQADVPPQTIVGQADALSVESLPGSQARGTSIDIAVYKYVDGVRK